MTKEQQKHTFDIFIRNVKDKLENTAKEKDYNIGGVDSPNLLDLMTHKHFSGHSLGEVVYKCIRFRAKGDTTDLEKAAAWLFLEWRNALKDKK